jgi:hypothetical protein
MNPAMPAEDRRSARLAFWGLIILLVGVYYFLTNGHFFSTDEIHVFQATESLVKRGNLSIEPMNDAVQGRDGRFYSQKGIGPTLVAIPLELAALAADRYLPESWKRPLAGATIGDHGQWGGNVRIFVVNLFNIPVTALLCAVSFLYLRSLGYAFRVSLFAAFVLGLTTILVPYTHTFFHHTLMALCLVGAAYALRRRRLGGGTRWLALAGAALGLAVLTRVETLLLAPVFLLYAASAGDLRDVVPAARARWREAWWVAVPLLACTLLCLAVNEMKFGSFFRFGVGAALDQELGPNRAGAFSGPLLVGLYGHLFSVGRSVFLYSPVLILAMAGLRRFYRKHAADMLLLASCSVILLLVYSKYLFWHGAWGWGNRFLLPAVPLLLVPFAEVVESAFVPRAWGARTAIVLFCATGLAVQALGVCPYISNVYWHFITQKYNPPEAYLFVPEISPIAIHFDRIVQQHDIDLWLRYLAREWGVGAMLIAACPGAAALFLGAALLRKAARPRGARDAIGQASEPAAPADATEAAQAAQTDEAARPIAETHADGAGG